MKVQEKSLEIVFSLLLAAVFMAADVWKDPSSRTDPVSIKKPFTVQDSLNLEFLDYWSYPRFATSDKMIAYAAGDGYHERSKEEEAGTRFFVPQGSHIFVQPLRGGQPVQLTEGPAFSWSPSWSPDGSKLAFYGLAQDRVQIGLWDKNTNRIEYIDTGNLFGRGNIEWDPQGQRIFFSSNPQGWKGNPEPYEKSENPIVRTNSDKVNPYDERFMSAYLSQLTSYDFGTKRTRSIIPRPMAILSSKLSPDGKHVALLELVKNKIRVLDTTNCDFAVYPVDGGEPKTIVPDSEMTQFAWSADGQRLAYVDGGKLFIYSLPQGKIIQLGPDGLRVTGDPVWFPDDKQIFCAAGKEYYFFRVQSGKAESIRIDGPYSKGSYFLDHKGTFVYFKVVDESSGKQGISRTSFKDHKREELLIGDWMIGEVSITSEGLLLTLQNSTTPENIWLLDAITRERHQITSLNKQTAAFTFGKSELVSWNSTDGEPLEGVLLYPANYEKGRKYPVIFWVYETFSSQLHHFYLHLYNLQILANQGYAVFLPDVKFTTGDTSLSYIRSVEPAMDRLLELGLANGNFGVMGHSFGGYATNAIVTHSKRFKAAVAISGISDWVSFHGLPGDYMRLSNERGQGRMGGDLREFPERYVKNSPVFFLHQVETPLMILHGTNDNGVPFSQAEEMYYGLRHLNKIAVLVGYPGEDHLYWETKISVIKDMWQRIIAWFDKYLR